MTTVQIYDRVGAAKVLERSYAWVHLSFKNGVLPTEVMINQRSPGITKPTLQRIAKRMKRKQMN